MAKAKTPRTPSTNLPTESKQVITMPDSTAATPAKKIVKAASPNSSPSINPTPIDLEAQIRQRAYELYEERGCIDGYENEDWLQAEHEVRSRLTRQQSA